MEFKIIMPRIRRELYNKEICACSIFGAMNRDGERFTGAGVMKAIANMHVRGNGLGGGFAAYGIYPEYKDYYAFHLMFTGKSIAGQNMRKKGVGCLSRPRTSMWSTMKRSLMAMRQL